MTKDLKHEILSELLKAASELGRTPSRPEFHKYSKYTVADVMNNFGSYANLITASKLSEKPPKKADKQEIKKKKLIDSSSLPQGGIL